MIRVYNTLTGQKEDFSPISPPRVTMYVCGPTVYGPAHIGHAKTYIVFDVVRRYLEYRGYDVEYVVNITDVDDKIIARSNASGEPWNELAERYAREFLEEMDELNVLPASKYPRASGNIHEIIADVLKLVESSHAYVVDGDVYFRVESDPDYGKLSGRRLSEMRAGARVEVDERKEHPMDFALWKAAKPGEPYWESPWGRGRPGWHMECTTMSTRNLGPQIDVHGAGADLIFPHNENEIAQSECLTHKVPFVRYWMHSGLLQLEEEKMARSVGNVLSVPGILDRFGADAFRWYVLSTLYRRSVAYSEEAIEFAARTVRRVSSAAALAPADAKPDLGHYAEQRSAFEAAMDDDFNTPQALAVLSDLAREASRLGSSGEDPSPPAALLREFGDVLGLRLEVGAAERARNAEPFIDLLVEVRGELRRAKQYALADRVRERLRELGIALEDVPGGETRWRAEE